MRAFNRALLIVVGDGLHGDTHAEIAISTLGLLGGTAALAYFTSTMVTLVTSLNQADERARQKIIRVGQHLSNTRIPASLQVWNLMCEVM